MATKIINDFTTGSIPKKMIFFAVPFMLSNALQVFYNVVDMIIVGQFVGANGISAVNNAMQIIILFVMMCIGISSAGQVCVSQIIGTGERTRLNKMIGTIFSVVGLAGITLSIFGSCLSEPLLTLIKTPHEKGTFEMAVQYSDISFYGMFFTYGYLMISSVLRGMGDSKHPFVFIVIASLINIVLDYVFVAPFASAPHTEGILHYVDSSLSFIFKNDFRFGVAGAAWATIIGQAISFICAMTFLYRRKDEFHFDFKLSSFRIFSNEIQSLVKLGIPFALQSCAINISMMYVNYLVNGLGVAGSATFGVGTRIDDVVNKITLGIGFAVSGMVGQNFGAGLTKRVKHVVCWSWALSSLFYIPFVAALVAWPQKMFGLFTTDESVLSLAPDFVWAIIWQFPALLIMKGTQGFIQGIGNAAFSLAIAILDGVVLRIFCSWYFGVVQPSGLGVFEFFNQYGLTSPSCLKPDLWGFIFGYGLATWGTALPAMVYFLFCPWHKRAKV